FSTEDRVQFDTIMKELTVLHDIIQEAMPLPTAHFDADPLLRSPSLPAGGSGTVL
ncbi:hypothetical protein SARC_12282, partial [Sphaeroforma arctica JP610]